MTRTTAKFMSLCLISFFSLGLMAQKTPIVEQCGTAILQKNTPNAEKRTQKFEEWMTSKIKNSSNNTTLANLLNDDEPLYTIPIVVHVIHNGDPINDNGDPDNENISYNQIASQIDVLNEDYRRIEDSPGAEVSNYEAGVDTQIEFELAKRGPNGEPTNGINRVNLCEESWGASTGNPNVVMNIIEENVKPNTIWDPEKYLNIWVVKFGGFWNNSLFGYAHFPEQSTLDGISAAFPNPELTDGVVVGYQTVGSAEHDDGSFTNFYLTDMGRTATHEVGHWLGLRHIWGDGGCSAPDYCDDTPDQENQSSQNETDCIVSFSCGSDDMIENYMDYSNESCQNTFTQDQKDRMHTVLENSPRREEVATISDALSPVSMTEEASIKMQNCIVETMPCTSMARIPIEIHNHGSNTITDLEISYTINDGTTEAYIWDGNLQTNAYETVYLPNIDVSDGENDIDIELTTVNGQADEIADNNIVEEVLMYQEIDSDDIEEYNETEFVFNLETDEYGEETTWDLRNSEREVLYEGGPYNSFEEITEEITLNADACYVFTVYDSFGDGIEPQDGFYELQTQNGTEVAFGDDFGDEDQTVFSVGNLSVANEETKKLSIYPNPATTTITVETNGILPTQYTIYNTLGKIIEKNKVITKEDLNIDVSSCSSGVYFMRLKSNTGENIIRFIKE